MNLYETAAGRFLWARWDERQAQFISTDGVGVPQGYCYSFARTIEGLAPIVRTWGTARAARAARRRRA